MIVVRSVVLCVIVSGISGFRGRGLLAAFGQVVRKYVHYDMSNGARSNQRGPERFETPVPAYSEKPATLREFASQKY